MEPNNAIDFQNGWFLTPWFPHWCPPRLCYQSSTGFFVCFEYFLSLYSPLIKDLKDLLPFLVHRIKKQCDSQQSVSVGGWVAHWIKQWGRKVREKNYGEVKGYKMWNRSGLKQEQGRDKVWQVLEQQGRELRQESREIKKKKSDSEEAGSDRV